jgi:predicted O-methyltransferase YrrM
MSSRLAYCREFNIESDKQWAMIFCCTRIANRSELVDVAASIEYLRANGLTYCGRTGKLETLHQLAARVEANSVPGIFVEAGVAMGGSACIIAKTKHPKRELHLFDVFDMLPPPTERDGQRSMEVYQYFRSGNVQGLTDINYVTHARDMLSFVRQNMHRLGVDPDALNIHFVKGLYQDTLHIDRPVAFAHIDCDWYDSVMLCINRIADHLSVGGIMLFDDYHSFEGCRRAVDAWLAADARFQMIHADWTVAVERVAGPGLSL